MSHPSVFFAACEDVDTAEIVMFRNTTFFPSFTCHVRSFVRPRATQKQRCLLTKLIHSGPLIILMFCTVTSVAWYRVNRIGRTVPSSFALHIQPVNIICPPVYARKNTHKASYQAWPEPSSVPPPSRTMFVPPRSQNAAWSWKENVNALSVQ